jgi:hypothetical protein
MTANGLLVRFAGNSLRVLAGDPAFLSAIKTHFNHCLGADGEVVAVYEIEVAGGGHVSIVRDGVEVVSKAERESASQRFMQDALTQLNGASHTDLVFHAAAVALEDAGVLICGRSGSGKSTLTADLLADGFRYLTDEVISWPAKTAGQVTGFCRSLVLKRGSEFLWKRWADEPGVNGLLRFADGGAWIAPELLGGAAVCQSVSPRLLLFANYEAESPIVAKPLSSGEALFRLLESLVDSRNFADGGLAATGRLARAAAAFSLTYSSLEGAREWIRTQLEVG